MKYVKTTFYVSYNKRNDFDVWATKEDAEAGMVDENYRGNWELYGDDLKVLIGRGLFSKTSVTKITIETEE